MLLALRSCLLEFGRRGDLTVGRMSRREGTSAAERFAGGEEGGPCRDSGG